MSNGSRPGFFLLFSDLPELFSQFFQASRLEFLNLSRALTTLSAKRLSDQIKFGQFGQGAPI